MDYSFVDYYAEYESYVSNAKKAAAIAGDHSVNSNIVLELNELITQLQSMSKSLSSCGEDETLISLVTNINDSNNQLTNLQSFLTSDYANAENVYIELYESINNLKELTKQLKEMCDNKPKQSSYKKNQTMADGSVKKVNDVNKYKKALNLWKNNVIDLKEKGNALKNDIDAYIVYLKSINKLNPNEGKSNIVVPSSAYLELNMSKVDKNAKSSPKSIEFQQVRYADTDVWYAIIPKSLQPKLGVATDSKGAVTSQQPSRLAQKCNAKIAINFSLTGVGYTKDKRKSYMGGGAGLLYDGEHLYKLRNNYHDTTLYMDQDGNLGYFYNDPSKNNQRTPDEMIKELNPKWAAKTFFPIAVDGQYVDENKDPNIGKNSVNPRTFIGQTQNGDYFIGVCTGRNSDGKQKGLTLKEVYDFSQEVTGGNIKFLMNGDGGGSSAFIYEGKKLNPDTDNEERARPDIIYWEV